MGVISLTNDTRTDTQKPVSRLVDLNLLDVFEVVYRTRNLTAAGEIMGLSQPAMSHALARLRKAYGDPLFVRKAQGLRSTPFADQLASPVTTALAVVRGTLQRKPFDPKVAQRSFKVATTDIGEQVFLPPLTKYLETHAPHVMVETKATSNGSSALVEELARGEIDVALGFVSRPGSEVLQKTLFTTDHVCVVGRHRKRVRKNVSMEEFARMRFVVPTVAGTGHAEAIDPVLQQHGLLQNVSLRVTNFLSVGPIVANTNLAAIVPANLARSFVNSWNLRIVELPVALPSFDVMLYWHKRYDQDPENRWFRSAIEALFSEDS